MDLAWCLVCEKKLLSEASLYCSAGCQLLDFQLTTTSTQSSVMETRPLNSSSKTPQILTLNNNNNMALSMVGSPPSLGSTSGTRIYEIDPLTTTTTTITIGNGYSPPFRKDFESAPGRVAGLSTPSSIESTSPREESSYSPPPFESGRFPQVMKQRTFSTSSHPTYSHQNGRYLVSQPRASVPLIKNNSHQTRTSPPGGITIQQEDDPSSTGLAFFPPLLRRRSSLLQTTRVHG